MSCVLIEIINSAKLLSWLLNLQRETFCCYQSSIQTPLGNGVVEGVRSERTGLLQVIELFPQSQHQLQVQLIKHLIWRCRPRPHNYIFCWARHPRLMYGRERMTGDDVSACSLVWVWWPVINAGVVLYTLHPPYNRTYYILNMLHCYMLYSLYAI